MNGLQLAAAVKGIQRGVSIVLLTGFGHAGLREGETPEGVDVVISKPVPKPRSAKRSARR